MSIICNLQTKINDLAQERVVSIVLRKMEERHLSFYRACTCEVCRYKAIMTLKISCASRNERPQLKRLLKEYTHRVLNE